MVKKIKAFFELFQAYKRVNNPAAWKKGQIGVDAVSAFFMACVSVYIYTTGVEINIANETIDSFSAALITAVPAIVGLWDGVATVITTNKIGYTPKNTMRDDNKPND